MGYEMSYGFEEGPPGPEWSDMGWDWSIPKKKRVRANPLPPAVLANYRLVVEAVRARLETEHRLEMQALELHWDECFQTQCAIDRDGVELMTIRLPDGRFPGVACRWPHRDDPRRSWALHPSQRPGPR